MKIEKEEDGRLHWREHDNLFVSLLLFSEKYVFAGLKKSMFLREILRFHLLQSS